MPTHRDPGRELRLFLDGRLLRGLLVMTMVAIGAVPVAAQTSTIGWDELGIADEAAIPTGTTFSDGGTEMTITWSTVTDGGSFVAAFGADFLSYEAGSQGGEVGNACMGFNNGNDDPDDKVILSLGFSPPVTGLTLSLLDVDSGTFDDGVEIFANGVNQRNSAAVVSIGSAVALDNETYMQGYEGIGTPVGTTSPNGNIDLDFTTTAMTTFRVEFFSTDDANANPGGQLVCLTDLDFDTRIDFGDAPNSYGTLLVDDGARHPLANGLLLGTSRDGIENDGIPTAAADGDGADEDGVTFSSPSGTGDSVFADVVVVNPTGGTVSVCGWLDIPAGGTVDGAFDASDGICQTTAAANPTLSFQWSGLPSDQQYDTYARFRVSSDTMTTADATGVFTDGEVEDYPVSFDFSPTRATIDSFAASFVAVETLRADAALETLVTGLAAERRVALIEWRTVAEQGTLSFDVERLDDPSGAWERVTATPLPALVVSRHGGHYLLVDDVVDVAGTVSYRLVEHEAWGGTLIHGPWTVDFAARNESRLDVDGPAIESAGLTWWPWRRLTDRFVGRGRSTTLEPSSVVARHDTRARRRELALTTVSPSSARSVNDARLFTTEPALYEVGVETLADVLGMRATELRDLTSRGGLRLTVGGEPIAYRLDTVADRVVFAVDAHTSLESLRNVVQVTRGQGVVMPIVEEAAPPLAGQVGTFRDTVVVEDDVWLLPWANREEGTDPWYWDFTFAPSTPSTVLRFDVPDPSGVGEVRARIVMRGASDLVAGDDHRAWVSIDGVALAGEVTWDGFDRVSLEISFDAAWLGDGENVELTLHTTAFGEATSLVLIDHLELDYSRRLRAVDGSLWIDHLEPGVTTVGGFTSPTIRVVESPTESARTVERRDLTVAPDGAGGWQVSFVVDRAATYVVSERERAVHAETDRVPPWARQRRSAGAEYVIIAPRSLVVGAEALATYRADRFAVETIWLDDVYDRFSFGRTDSRALERLLEEVWRTWDPAPRYVVLLGRGTHDHRDRQGFGDSVLPMRFASTPWGLYASDGRYADVDDDKVPDFALGRIAALDDEDVLAYVDKLRRFEASAAAGTMLLVADNPDLAGDFHANNDDLTRQLDAMGRSSRRLDHPIDPIRSELLATWADGSLSLINYTGHGAATQLASEGFLTVGDIDSWQAIDRPPVFTAWTCAVGDSTTPGLLGLADALVLAPGTGAIATVTPAGLSLDVPAHELNTFFFDAFIDDAHALGDAHRLMHEWGRNGGVLPWMLDVYFVAGDPAITLDP